MELDFNREKSELFAKHGMPVGSFDGIVMPWVRRYDLLWETGALQPLRVPAPRHPETPFLLCLIGHGYDVEFMAMIDVPSKEHAIRANIPFPFAWVGRVRNVDVDDHIWAMAMRQRVVELVIMAL